MTELEANLLTACKMTVIWLRCLPEDVRDRASLETILSTIIRDAEVK